MDDSSSDGFSQLPREYAFADEDDDSSDGFSQPRKSGQRRRLHKPAVSEELQRLTELVRDKQGENALLRKQLANRDAKHRSELGNVLDTARRAQSDTRDEISRLRQELEQNKVELRFAKAELRNATLNATPFQCQLPSQARVNADITENNNTTPRLALPNMQKRRAINAFNDGFVLKRAKTAETESPFLENLHSAPKPSNFASTYRPPDPSSQSPIPEFRPLSWSSDLSADTGEILPRHMQGHEPHQPQYSTPMMGIDTVAPTALNIHRFATHHMPGSKVPTLQQLYASPVPDDPHSRSFGSILACCASPADASRTIGHLVDTNSGLPEVALLLLALQAELFPAADPPCHVLMKRIVGWLESLVPFPSLDEAQRQVPTVLLDRTSCWSLNCVLYALDLLRMASVIPDLPDSFFDPVLSCGIPSVMMRGVELLSRVGRRGIVPRGSSNHVADGPLFPVAPRPSVETVFGGLLDNPVALCVTQMEMWSPKFVGISSSLLVQRVQLLAIDAHYDLRETSVDFAARFGFRSSDHVLDVLRAEVDLYPPSPAQNRLVAACIRFFWLMDVLPTASADELVICAAKVAYNGDIFGDAVTAQAMDLLHKLVSPGELDELFSVMGPSEGLRTLTGTAHVA